MSRAEKLANAFVRAKEQVELEKLGKDARVATLHAEGCGCLQCLKHAEALRDEFVDESIRVNVRSMDQEEEWIMNWAVNHHLLGEPYEDNGE